MPKSEVMKRWYKLKMGGRLCWKRKNWRWRNTFDSDDVAVWIEGSTRMHFKALSAIEEFLDYCEWVTGLQEGRNE